MKKLFFVILALFSISYLYSASLDSLYIQLDKYSKSNPTKTLKIIEQIYKKVNYTDGQKAIEIVARAIYLSDSVIGNKNLSAKWKSRLALLYLKYGQLDQAIRYFVELRDFYKSKDKVNYGITIMHLGDLFRKLSVSDISMEYYNNAKKIFKEINNLDYKVLVEARQAQLFYDDYKIDTAYFIMNKIVKRNEISDKVKAEIQRILAQLYLNDELWDSAAVYYKYSIDYYKKIRDEINLADLLVKLAKIYYIKKQNKKAIELIDSALVVFQKNKLYTELALSYNELGKISLNQNDEEKAIKFFLQAIEYGQLAQNKKVLLEAYKYLSDIYEQQGQIKRALLYHKHYAEQMQQYYEHLISRGYTEIILTFQNEEKQKEIEILKKEEKLRTQQLKFSLGVLALFFIFIIVIVIIMRRLQKTKLLLEEQYKQIKLQKRELETQSRILEKATQRLLKQKEKIEKQNLNIASSIRYASRIQMAMLPNEKLFATFFDDYFIYYKPKEVVSGDFYWIAEIVGDKPSLFREEKKRKIILAVGDCTGHGVPGAFMSMLGDAYLNQIIKIQHITEPDRILYELNYYIRETLQHNDTESMDGMDIGICTIDFQMRTLDFAGAKQDLIYIQGGRMFRVHGDTHSIGGLKQERNKFFTLKKIDITVETIFYMYTDGFQDQFGGPQGRKYMAKRFRDFIFSICDKPMFEQKKAIHEEFLKWKGKKYHQMDDITIIGVKIKSKYDV